MPISGLVVVHTAKTGDPMPALRADARVTIGDVEVEGRIPIIVETETQNQHRECMKWLGELDGVTHIELAYADYRSEADATTAAGSVQGSSPNAD